MSTDDNPTTQDAPDCDRCGTRTYATTRTMRTHDITTGRALPRDTTYQVWRCPSCGREAPRS